MMNINNRSGILMTYIRPKLNHWLNYLQQYQSTYTKIIKYIKKEYNRSGMNEYEFITNHSNIFRLLDSYNYNLNQGLNVYMVETERKKIKKYQNHDAEFDKLVRSEIVDEDMALKFMYKYNGLINTIKQSDSSDLSSLRMIPRMYPMYVKTENQRMIFKNITPFEYQKLRMLNNLAKKIMVDETKKLLSVGTMDKNVLPNYLDKKTINHYQEICKNKNMLVNDLQSMMRDDDIFDLTQNFESNEWIIEEIMCLNYMISQQ